MNIDTIRLKFPYSLPSNDHFREKVRGKQAWTNNVWRKREQKTGRYIPKYWIEEDYVNSTKTYFYFEASIPKLVHGENITTLHDCQFEEVVAAIVEFCKEVGVYIFPNLIRNATPTLVAIGKNINLTKCCYASTAVKILKPFDYKPHSSQRIIDFSDQKHGGKEVIFSTRDETFKAYDKGREIQNSAGTFKEFELADLLKSKRYVMDGKVASEILRIELTLKTKRKIQQKLKPYLDKQTLTFENIFNSTIWQKILKDEVNKTFNHSFQKIIFLALESQPYIDNFLEEHYSHIQTKDTVNGILTSLHNFGLAETRKRYLENYKSRQTWYNYLKRLKELEKHFDWTALSRLDNVKVHSYILEQFGISNRFQQQLELFSDTQLSKKIDMKLRNA